MSHAEAQAFFEAYRDAFNRLDGDAVADLWHTPSAITNTEAEAASAKLTLWSDEEPMRANHRAPCDAYRDSGYGHATFEVLDCTSLAPGTTCCAWRTDSRCYW